MKKTVPKTPATAVSRAPRPRDAVATMQLIRDTAVRLLAENGFTSLGVNALAAAAGVDKQLIYYHFGGLDGVLRQLGGQLELWLGAPLQPQLGEPYAQAANRLLMEYTGALRRNPLVLRLLAWELVEPSDVLRELEATRSKAMAGWVAGLRNAAGPVPKGADAPAINALLLAALHYLALREHSVGSFAGLDIQTPGGAERISKAIEYITRRVYTPDPDTSPGTPAPPPRAKRAPSSSKTLKVPKS